MLLQIVNPRPVPLGLVVKKGSKTFSLKSAGIPTPLSSTSIRIFSFPDIESSLGENRDALIDELCQLGSGNLIQRIGNVALIYRPNPDDTRIRLP